jgi:hypothetical protein
MPILQKLLPSKKPASYGTWSALVIRNWRGWRSWPPSINAQVDFAAGLRQKEVSINRNS